MREFDAARSAWRAESALLRDSYWRRAWGSGATAVEEGAAGYARAQAALVAAGWPVAGAVPGTGLPGMAPSHGAASISALFSGPTIAILAVVGVLLIARK